jgi:hypothetical protein
MDKVAKAIGSPCINTQVSLGAFIGEGNKNFCKYSILGHIYFFTLIVLEEAVEEAINENTVYAALVLNESIEEKLSRPALYK